MAKKRAHDEATDTKASDDVRLVEQAIGQKLSFRSHGTIFDEFLPQAATCAVDRRGPLFGAGL